MKSREKRPRKIRAVEKSEAPPAPEGDAEDLSEAAAEGEHPISHAAPAMPDEAEAPEASAEGDAEEQALANGAGEPAAELQGDESQPPAEGAAGESIAPPIDRTRMKAVLESLIFVSERTVTAVQLGRAAKMKTALVRELVAELTLEYASRGIELIEVAGGYQFRSAPACAEFVREFVAQKPVRLTSAQLETLALIAYRQPMTRPEIDDVRGVDSGSAMRVLLERNLIKMLGRKDEPGRPLLYGTTGYFLEFFGMRSLKDLPTLREFTDLSEESRALFKRKTGEAIEEAEAALFTEQEDTASDEPVEHISDEDLAALAREADAEAESAGEPEADPPMASIAPEDDDRAATESVTEV